MQSLISIHNEFAEVAPSRRPLGCLDSGSGPPVPFDLRELWGGLVRGAYVIASTLCSDTRCFAAVQRRSAASSDCAPDRAGTEILHRLLLGERQKCVAADFGRSLSTVCCAARRSLRRMAGEQLTSRAPVLLVMAAHAARGFRLTDARLSCIEDAIPGRCVVSTTRPDHWLADVLSPAEYQIARLVVEGNSHAEMAGIRGTSIHTVSNQLASIFDKLEVSGRAEFLAKLVRGTCVA